MWLLYLTLAMFSATFGLSLRFRHNVFVLCRKDSATCWSCTYTNTGMRYKEAHSSRLSGSRAMLRAARSCVCVYRARSARKRVQSSKRAAGCVLKRVKRV